MPKKISLLKKVWIIFNYSVIFVVIYLNLSGGGVILNNTIEKISYVILFVLVSFSHGLLSVFQIPANYSHHLPKMILVLFR